MNFTLVTEYLIALQNKIIEALSLKDGCPLVLKKWESSLGVGQMALIEEGNVFERGGVNFSNIAANKLPAAASERYPHLVGQSYQACGVSLVLHPKNPYCPTVHMNVRFFSAGDIWWFGGGMDLTPYYGFYEDCQHFHAVNKEALNSVEPSLYSKFKRQCDDYFYIRHRKEARGIGGTFFDDYNVNDFDRAFSVMKATGDAFLPAYLPIIEKRQHTEYGERQRRWQQHRRGRYVEFNLVYDRGTLFGLQAGGRVDAILMSLPPIVRWGECVETEEEKSLLINFLPARDWV